MPSSSYCRRSSLIGRIVQESLSPTGRVIYACQTKFKQRKYEFSSVLDVTNLFSRLGVGLNSSVWPGSLPVASSGRQLRGKVEHWLLGAAACTPIGPVACRNPPTLVLIQVHEAEP